MSGNPSSQDDDLSAPRGILLGTVVGTALWIAVFVWLVMR